MAGLLSEHRQRQKKFMLYRYLVIFLIICNSCQDHGKQTQTSTTTVKSRFMDLDDFNQLVKKSRKSMCDTSHQMTIAEAINYVKIENTFGVYLDNDTLFSQYHADFNRCCWDKVATLLKMQPSFG